MKIMMNVNLLPAFNEAVEKGKIKSLTDEYKGCQIHINYRASHDYFTISDWFDTSTCASIVNGEVI
jgi:hypothetical protein